MGSRDFDNKDVPFRSKFGNIMTRKVFSAVCGIKISDTQTGLRAIPTSLVRKFMKTKGEQFEYEMNMLVDCKQYDMDIVEVPIETVYLEENESLILMLFLTPLEFMQYFWNLFFHHCFHLL